MTIQIQEKKQLNTEQFTERFLSMLNSASTMLMVSIGHQVKLFDIMAELPYSTSQEIANKSKLNERYIREWLGAMVTSKIVLFNGENNTYYLPKEHAAILTRAASPDNLAVFAQYIPLLGSVEKNIINSFKHGGGVPYSEFDDFHRVMSEDSGQTVLAALDDHLLPLIPGIKEKLTEGIKVADVGCGRGLALIKLAKSYPASYFVGYDFSEEAIEFAKTEAENNKLPNIRFEVRDAAKLNEFEEYDLITTFDAIHDQKEPLTVIKQIYQALKPNGVYFMQDIHGSGDLVEDINHPIGPLLYTVSAMHCMTVSLAVDGAGLGTMWGVPMAKEYLKEAGFSRTRTELLDHDIQNIYYINEK